jgi:ASC-1-like (ASCH) protein
VRSTPAFTVRKELFAWIKEGKKTIELRKGNPSRGDFAVFLSGRNYVRLSIVKKETGTLSEVIRQDNYRQIIPSAEKLEDALKFLKDLYKTGEGTFTAYYIENNRN